MANTNVDALKELCAAIATKAGEEVSPAEVKGDTVADVIRKITKAYKGESIFDNELAKLTLESTPGTEFGYTKIAVSGSVGSGVYKYKATSELPTYGQSLADWTAWDGVSELELEDSSTVVVCEVDENELAIAGGTTFVNSNMG